MYAILGATGHTGSVITETLLAKGQKVRTIGRDPKRLEQFAAKGAETFIAEATDADALSKAFSGAKAAYILIPPNVSAADIRGYQERVSDAATLALGKAGVPYAVALSSFGADKPDRTGPVVGLHNLEQKLNAISELNALYLRPGYFMENMLPQVTVIQSFGVLAGPLRPDLAVPMIATRDIGAAAADALHKLNFHGKQTRELHGPRNVTYIETAKIVGAAIGKPDLTYVQMPPAQLKPALMQMGFSANMADQLLEMSDALNEGYMATLEPPSAANTMPTTLETFVTEVFVPAYRGKAAGA
jgi:uncharacterized protein YbjT (DUF2867 family)